MFFAVLLGITGLCFTVAPHYITTEFPLRPLGEFMIFLATVGFTLGVVALALKDDSKPESLIAVTMCVDSEIVQSQSSS